MPSIGRTSAGGQNHDRLRESNLPQREQDDGQGHDGTAAPAEAGAAALDISMGQKMASAMSGSLLTSLLVTPLDVVRVRLQSQKPYTPTPGADFSRLAMTTNKFVPVKASELGVTACCREVFFAGNTADYCLAVPRVTGLGPSSMGSPADCAVEETQRNTYRSTVDGLRKIARNEGVTTLWRGLSPTLAMAIPANIIYFTGYDWLRYNRASPFSTWTDTYAPLAAGSVARVLAATAVSPIELVRTRMQAAAGTSTTKHLVEAFRGIREMVDFHGYTSLWRGLTLMLWRDVPFSGLYWWGYETIRLRLAQVRGHDGARSTSRLESPADARRREFGRQGGTETLVDSFIAGATSGAFASFITTPFDVGKTRTQVHQESFRTAQGSSSAVPCAATAAAKAPEQGSMVRLLWHIFETEGAQGLWRGWIPRTLKVAPACAIMISSYEVGKRIFRGANERATHKDIEAA